MWLRRAPFAHSCNYTTVGGRLIYPLSLLLCFSPLTSCSARCFLVMLRHAVVASAAATGATKSLFGGASMKMMPFLKYYGGGQSIPRRMRCFSYYYQIAEQSPERHDKKIPEDLFRGRKDAENTVEISFCARKSRRKIFLPGLSAEKSVFLPSEKIFRGHFPMDEGKSKYLNAATGAVLFFENEQWRLSSTAYSHFSYSHFSLTHTAISLGTKEVKCLAGTGCQENRKRPQQL